ncbi:HutD family protein [Novosphingobium sp. 1949]|uniref:HutD family protein n=1 Tax=Novosphingobium organovorum TaxID=2930092 RepID=A0ABT0BDA1_9SPHN|nr:HutD family protein [Novosphingobium organovorum]MCJ2183002.1 HutD family protein [Novosphingobium organovorum]
MNALRIIRASRCPDLPWKNGGGTTREIAVFPPGAGMEDFLWRLSMANVERPGPFSHFDGVDRVLAVLEGTLHLTGPALDAALDPGSDPLAFAADQPVDGAPIGGPVRDLNAMVRRSAFTVRMVRLQAGERAECPDAVNYFLALEAQQLAGEALAAFDCAQVSGALTCEGAALLVSFVAIRA